MIYVIIAAAAAVLILSAAVGYIFFKTSLIRGGSDKSIGSDGMKLSEQWKAMLSLLDSRREWMSRHTFESIEVESFDGLKLRARFFPAEVESNKYAVLIHGYKGSDENSILLPLMHERGINVILPCNRAHGDSEGKYIGFGWLDRLDVVMWCRWAEKRSPDAQTVLWGVSMGGATVSAASSEDILPKSVVGIIDDCGYSSAWEQMVYVVENSMHLPGKLCVSLGNLWCRLLAEYNLRNVDICAQVANCSVPMMFIHGNKDDFVPFEFGKKLFEAAGKKGDDGRYTDGFSKQFVEFDGAVHACSYVADTEMYEQRINEFLDTIGI